ncbi:MAG: hypothetical protein Q4F07_10025 [Bacteroidales bacterium]|nr:hypothetical protein [Bacteroidales bacterium]
MDAELSPASAHRAMKDMNNRLSAVKTEEFISGLKDVINKYYNNLLDRISRECPSISDGEQTILALLCGRLSPRIISFILNIKPQTVYNAKSAIKRKLKNSSLTRPEKC